MLQLRFNHPRALVVDAPWVDLLHRTVEKARGWPVVIAHPLPPHRVHSTRTVIIINIVITNIVIPLTVLSSLHHHRSSNAVAAAESPLHARLMRHDDRIAVVAQLCIDECEHGNLCAFSHFQLSTFKLAFPCVLLKWYSLPL
jgi:hypothetical protein